MIYLALEVQRQEASFVMELREDQEVQQVLEDQLTLLVQVGQQDRRVQGLQACHQAQLDQWDQQFLENQGDRFFQAYQVSPVSHFVLYVLELQVVQAYLCCLTNQAFQVYRVDRVVQEAPALVWEVQLVVVMEAMLA